MFTTYLATIARQNGLDRNGPVTWFFYDGMLFSSPAKWWGDFKIRASVHEGVDITYYTSGPHGAAAGSPDGTKECKPVCTQGPFGIRQFDPSIRVPAFEAGRIINICRDFLGQTLVVEQPAPASGFRVIFAYAHINPSHGLEPGMQIQKDQCIATVCDTARNPLLPPHLHFSCFEVPRSVPVENLNWDLFSKPGQIRMVNPAWL